MVLFPWEGGARRGAAGVGAAVGAALLAVAGGVAAEPAPPPPGSAEAGLLGDLEKMVESQASLGWTIDRYELEELIPTALMSVCSTPEAARDAVLEHLEARIEALGGPVEEAYRKRGNDLGKVSVLLFTSRVRALLGEAMLRAGDECPFWLEPSSSFHGLQTDAYRFTLNVEGGGLLVLHHADDKLTFGGGGSGRLLLGRGLDPRWTVLGGLEVGGHAQFEQTETETRFPIILVVAAPLVLRGTDRTWHYEFEVAGLGYFTQTELRVSPGVRGGLLLGLSTLRIRSVMPWAGVGAAFEYVFPTSFRGPVWSLRAGARIGFDWDF